MKLDLDSNANFVVKVRQIGGSKGIIIPKDTAFRHGIRTGSYVRVIILPIEKNAVIFDDEEKYEVEEVLEIDD